MILCRRILSLAALLLAAVASASENAQPIQVEADQLTVEESSGVSVYSGNVRVSQGPLHLIADEVRIYSTGDAVTRIVASVQGEDRLARYEQLPGDDRMHVEGEAREIVYHLQEERLEFNGSAMLSQADETTGSGEKGEYDAAAGRVNATSGADGRVKTTIRQAGQED